MSIDRQKRPFFNSLFGWKQSAVLSGKELELFPKQVLHINQMSILSARFPVAAKRIQHWLPHSKFKLVTRNAGTAELLLVGMQVQEVDGLNAFNQFSIGTLVQPITDKPDYKPQGFFHFYTPVTTQQACKIGKKSFGFPTFMANINFEETTQSIACHVSDHEAHILTLHIKKQETHPDLWAQTNITTRQGRIQHSYFQAKGESITSDRSSYVHCELGSHSLADRLSELRLGSISLGHRFSSQAEALLHQTRLM